MMAQTVTAQLEGTVMDGVGAAVPNAKVTVRNTATDISREIIADAEGRYLAPNLQPGPYDVSVEAEGFTRKVFGGITLNVGEVQRLDAPLQVGSTSESVSVSATSSAMQLQTSSNSALVDNKQVVELPLNNRQFYDLALLSPAAYQPAQNSTLGFRGGIAIAGASEISNQFTVNGVYNNDMGTAQPSFRPSVEVIQEFRLLTGVYPAEYGRMSGGQVVIITKSGTNSFHGSAYEFLRNQITDARNYFTPAGDPVPEFKQNTFGGTVGGPIWKDRTFFFFGYEGQRIRSAVTAQATVPTAAMLSGMFNTGETLYDPNTGAPLTPLPGTTSSYDLTTAIPGSGPINWNSSGAKAGQLIANLGFNPAPPTYATPAGTLPANNYLFNETRVENMNEVTFRADHKLSEKDQLNGSFNIFKDPAFEPSNSLCSSYVLPNFGCFTNQISTLINATWDRIITPNLLNDFRLGYQRLQQPRVQQDDTSIGSAYPGLPGGPYFTEPNYANNMGLPNTSISGYSTIGGATNLPQNRWDNHYEIGDTLSWVHGAHSIKAGADLLLVRATNLITSDGRGAFSVSDSNIYSANGKSTRVGSTGDSLADFLLGLTYTSTIGPTAGLVYLDFQSQDFFAMDDWKVKPNLTLNLGLRYELDHPVYSDNNTLSNFSLASETFVQAGVNGASKGLYNSDNNNFAPRLGFSYQPYNNDKTVIKGAVGMFYNTPLLYNQFLSNGTQAPFRFVSTYQTAASTAGNVNTISLAAPFSVPNTAVLPPCLTGAQTGCSSSLSPLSIQRDYRTPYLSEWSLGVQQAVTKTLVFESTYFGSKGTRLPLSVPVNVVDPATFTSTTHAPTQADRPYPNFSVVSSQDTRANSEYHSWQNSLTQSYSNGITFILAYTFGKSIDGGGGVGSSSQSSGTVQNVYNLRGDRGLSDFDVRNRVVFSPVVELPFGKNKAYLNHGLDAALFGGFQLSGIFSYQTGRPFTITDEATNNSGYYENADRPNVIGNPSASVNSVTGAPTHTVAQWFNTAAFALAPSFKVNTDGVVTQVGQFGNAGRNIIEGPKYTDLDLTLARTFPIRESIHGEFRAESFNLLNHPNFLNPLTNGVEYGASGFGAITQANNGREFQFVLRILF
jgi:hypothetical protein